ncbi:MAG: hypothetical protein K1X89_22725 [Myxococcaceae bacterium]|nr:hypothetical protein [Myxococcaceae bacterium]
MGKIDAKPSAPKPLVRATTPKPALTPPSRPLVKKTDPKAADEVSTGASSSLKKRALQATGGAALAAIPQALAPLGKSMRLSEAMALAKNGPVTPKNASLSDAEALAKTDPAGAVTLIDKIAGELAPGPARDAFLKQAAPLITTLTAQLAKQSKDAQRSGGSVPELPAAVTSLMQLTALASDPSIVTDAIAKGIDDRDSTFFSSSTSATNNPFTLALFDAFHADPAGGAAFGAELAASLQAQGKTASANDLLDFVQPYVTSVVVDANAEYSEAHDRVEVLNQHLAQELANLGEGVTDADRQRYIDQFHRDHQADYDAEVKAAAKLGEAITRLGPALQQVSDPDVQRQIFDALDALAQSPEGAQAALDVADALAKNPESPLALSNDAQDRLPGIVERAIPNLYAEKVKEHGGDAEAAAEEVEDILDSAEGLGKLVTNGADVIRRGLAALRTGDPASLLSLPEGPFKSAFLAAGVVVGAAGLFSAESFSDYTIAIADTGSKGLELLAEATKDLSGVFKEAGELAEKLAPRLTVIASAISLSEDFEKLVADGNAGTVIQLLGDAAVAVGGVLAASGVGLPVAAVLDVVGSLVSVIGAAIDADLSNDDRRKETEKILIELGYAPGVAKGLAGASKESIAELSEAGYSPTQLQATIGAAPELFEDAEVTRVFLELAQTTKVGPRDAAAFAGTLHQSDSAAEYLREIGAAEHDPVYPLTEAQRRDRFATLLSDPDFAAAGAYVRQHDPGFFGQAEQTVRDADLDFDDAWRSGNTELAFGDDLEAHLKDPAYLAEYVKRIVARNSGDGRSTDVFAWIAQDIGGKAVRSALDAAHAAGTISDEDYRRALDAVKAGLS